MASTADGFDGYELMLGATRGIRQFTITYDGFLTGVIHHTPYRPGESVAACWRNAVFHEEIYKKPHTMATCACGFYAYYSEENRMYADFGVTGIIEGYGKTVVGTKGFRSEKARVVALVLPDTYQSTGWRAWAIRLKWLFWTLGFLVWFLMFFLIATNFHSWIGILSALVAPLMGTWLLSFPVVIQQQEEFKARSAPRPISPVQETLLRQHYPNTKIFPTIEAMLKEYPLGNGVTLDREAV